ncbi:hypothetical protein KY338_00430 [Candidatus Woesearchaeota archaeon]|nr:hypothetical protein [Candidatus Woesearchaeota archaeon]MBW3005214.1 hypothetical protein [Candidatus Woesearchaeota archaeon]
MASYQEKIEQVRIHLENIRQLIKKKEFEKAKENMHVGSAVLDKLLLGELKKEFPKEFAENKPQILQAFAATGKARGYLGKIEELTTICVAISLEHEKSKNKEKRQEKLDAEIDSLWSKISELLQSAIIILEQKPESPEELYAKIKQNSPYWLICARDNSCKQFSKGKLAKADVPLDFWENRQTAFNKLFTVDVNDMSEGYWTLYIAVCHNVMMAYTLFKDTVQGKFVLCPFTFILESEYSLLQKALESFERCPHDFLVFLKIVFDWKNEYAEAIHYNRKPYKTGEPNILVQNMGKMILFDQEANKKRIIKYTKY